MMKELAKLAIIAACTALAATSCRQAAHSSLFACVPADSSLVAGVKLSEVRQWPLYEHLPDSWRSALAPVEGAQTAILATGGKEFLLIAQGRFPSPPPGTLMAAPDLAIFGPSDSARDAAARYRTGAAPQTELLKTAESLPSGTPLWLVARGDAELPIPGNVTNFLSILRKARWIALTVQRNGALRFDLRATAPNEQAARAIEETLRADLTLAAAGEARRPEVAAVLKKAEVTRDGLGVEVRFSASDQTAARLFGL